NPAIPAAFARWISAIPPTAIWRTSRYGPNWRSATAVLPRCSFRRRTALEHLGAAGVDEHAEQAQRALGAPIESAHDLCRDAVRDVDDVARRGVRDQVQPQAGAIGLAVDLVRGLDALLDVREDRVLGEPAEPVAHGDGEQVVGRRVADRHRPRRAGIAAGMRIELGEDRAPARLAPRIVPRAPT